MLLRPDEGTEILHEKKISFTYFSQFSTVGFVEAEQILPQSLRTRLFTWSID